jgi:hypothetical protein
MSYYWHSIVIIREQPNSRLHGHDIFCETGRPPWKMHFSANAVIFREFPWFYTIFTIYKGFLQFNCSCECNSAQYLLTYAYAFVVFRPSIESNILFLHHRAHDIIQCLFIVVNICQLIGTREFSMNFGFKKPPMNFRVFFPVNKVVP